MWSVRVVRTYCLSCLMVALCCCAVKRLVQLGEFVPPSSLTHPDGGLLIQQPQEQQQPRSTAASVPVDVDDDRRGRDQLRSTLSSSSSSHVSVKLDAKMSPPSSTFNERSRRRTTVVHRRQRVVDDVAATRRTAVEPHADDDWKQRRPSWNDAIETDVVATETVADQTATTPPSVDDFSSLFGTGCRLHDRLGLPVHVAEHCDIVAGSGNSSSLVAPPPPCARLTCVNMLYDPSIADDIGRLAENFTTTHPIRLPADADLLNLTSSGVTAADKCAVWRRLYDFDDLPSITVEESDFPLAFNILAHRDAHQVARLLRAIYRPHNVYCVHIDARSPPDFRSVMTSLVSCFDNVRMASRLERIVYAGFSRLQADINCMKDHLQQGSVDWRYIINTAGQAFPLRTNAELVRILRLYNGSNDIEGIYGHRVLRSRFVDEWAENATAEHGTLKRTGRRNPPPPHDIDIVRGSAYGVFSRDFVRFIVDDQRARDLLDWSRTTYSPDELYWSTLHHTYSNPHLHTPGAFSGYPSKKEWLAVYANWGETKCRGRMVRSVCVFGVGDLPALIRRRELFANKFYADTQPLALDCLEAWLRHKETCPPPFDYDYYSKLTFIPKLLV